MANLEYSFVIFRHFTEELVIEEWIDISRYTRLPFHYVCVICILGGELLKKFDMLLSEAKTLLLACFITIKIREKFI